jgi:LemA protein
MSKGIIVLIVVVVAVLLGFLWWQGTRNSLVQKDEGVKAQLGTVQTAYQRRADLIPNLVKTVEASALAERQTLTDVISARSRATSVQLTPEALKDPQAFQNFEAAQQQLTGALSRLLVTIEKYPDLKSQENFTVLMKEIEGAENRIAVARTRYNEVVQDYNSTVRSFPASIVAGTAFPVYPYFQAGAGAENAPDVNFNGITPNSGSSPNGQGAPSTTPAPTQVPSANQQPRGLARPAPATR